MIKEILNNPKVPSYLKEQYQRGLLSEKEFIREAETGLRYYEEAERIKEDMMFEESQIKQYEERAKEKIKNAFLAL